jgi:hypothetical protein
MAASAVRPYTIEAALANGHIALDCAILPFRQAAVRLQGGVRGSIPLVSTTLTSQDSSSDDHWLIDGIQLLVQVSRVDSESSSGAIMVASAMSALHSDRWPGHRLGAGCLQARV